MGRQRNDARADGQKASPKCQTLRALYRRVGTRINPSGGGIVTLGGQRGGHVDLILETPGQALVLVGAILLCAICVWYPDVWLGVVLDRGRASG